MKTKAHATAALLLLALAPALTACTVTIVDPSTPVAPSQRTDAGAEPSEAGTSSPTTPSSDTGLSDDAQAQYDAVLAAVDTTMSCPDGPLTPDGDIVRVEGHCDALVIDIDAGAVLADDVDELTLRGSSTTVFVGDVKILTVTGSASTVYWTGPTPEVSDSGASNTLKKG